MATVAEKLEVLRKLAEVQGQGAGIGLRPVMRSPSAPKSPAQVRALLNARLAIAKRFIRGQQTASKGTPRSKGAPRSSASIRSPGRTPPPAMRGPMTLGPSTRMAPRAFAVGPGISVKPKSQGLATPGVAPAVPVSPQAPYGTDPYGQPYGSPGGYDPYGQYGPPPGYGPAPGYGPDYGPEPDSGQYATEPPEAFSEPYSEDDEFAEEEEGWYEDEDSPGLEDLFGTFEDPPEDDVWEDA